ncbi:MAG: LamG-like jellyroll fold domain-containing protein [Planctomycetota bacterium]|nr:LamG-like jellyroll fold domain-containing protein [Planctomycetota bacterium]
MKLVKSVAKQGVKTTGKAFLTVPSTTELDPTNKPLTLGGFLKSETGSGVLLAQGGQGLGYSLMLQDGVPIFLLRNQGLFKKVVGQKIETKSWVHLAVTLNPDGEAQLLVDGKPQGKPVKVGLISGKPFDALSFGADSGSFVGEYKLENGIVGEVRDVRIYWGMIKPKTLKNWLAGPTK